MRRIEYCACFSLRRSQAVSSMASKEDSSVKTTGFFSKAILFHFNYDSLTMTVGVMIIISSYKSYNRNECYQDQHKLAHIPPILPLRIKKIKGVHRPGVLKHSKMKVGPGAVSGIAHSANRRSLNNRIPFLH